MVITSVITHSTKSTRLNPEQSSFLYQHTIQIHNSLSPRDWTQCPFSRT